MAFSPHFIFYMGVTELFKNVWHHMEKVSDLNQEYGLI